ncbi:hypothetical protein DFA_08858 [Cavenderia fasciculata]|uniref:Uncharacterized protein n=1 Tax=Cavenderia fasciculata TaxID=261658 RepID=F4Q4R1_CACFS|nr:uncharacterized protein DFA_08858 [Cavenderia fasciculata]EGG17857.1 hypothetical protein DFA_08858 [Cavenderia fasciculata]|eukprot:XP_004356341.1 hypothetical protein DFA_08858 [Cavenderia fasciculata]
MTPYEGSCSGANQGIGYAFIVGECFAIAGDFYQVELTNGHDNATLYRYSDSACKSVSNSKEYQVGECYEAPDYVWNSGVVPSNYVHISISVNPTSIPQYGFRLTTYAPGDTRCQDNPQFYWYSPNHSVIKSYNESVTFYCQNNEPYEIYCDGGEIEGCQTTYNSMSCQFDFTHWGTHNYIEGTC